MNPLRVASFARRGFVRRGPPVHLTVFVTARCNLRCRHCFHWREVAGGARGPSLAQLRRLASSAGRMGPLLWVSLGGGEPTLREDLDEIALAFAHAGARHVTVPSNGLLPDRLEALARRFHAEAPRSHLALSISIDGPPRVHDRIRALPGAHARAVAALRRLVALARELPRLGVGLIATVTGENGACLAEHLEALARDVHPHNLTINLARGDALDRDQLAVDPDHYREVVEVKRRLQQEGVLCYFDFPLARVAVERDRRLYRRVERIARGEPARHLACTAGSLSAVVFEDGEVRPCEVLGESLGNLRDVGWDLARLWDTARAEALREGIRASRCTCTWECAQADNVLFDPLSWPGLAAAALRP